MHAQAHIWEQRRQLYLGGYDDEAHAAKVSHLWDVGRWILCAKSRGPPVTLPFACSCQTQKCAWQCCASSPCCPTQRHALQAHDVMAVKCRGLHGDTMLNFVPATYEDLVPVVAQLQTVRFCPVLAAIEEEIGLLRDLGSACDCRQQQPADVQQALVSIKK